MSEELKPCPFCGNVHEITETWYDGPLYGVEGDGCPVWVTAFEEDDTREREKVVNLYNSRPIEDALRAELEAERQKTRWMSVSDAEPLEDEVGWYYVIISKRRVWAKWNGDGFYVNGVKLQRVTHWMPLPEPPKDLL